MGKLYYIHDLKPMKHKNKEDINLEKIEKALSSISFIAEKEWRYFQSFLSKSEVDSTYWLKDKTQKELMELCCVIDVRGWDFEDKYDLCDLDGRFRSFLKNDKDEDFNVSWDSTYFLGFWEKNALIEEILPLYPKDVFAFFIILDRVILFYQEEKRRIEYELTQKRIQKLKLPIFH